MNRISAFKAAIAVICTLLLIGSGTAQTISRDQMIFLTREWQGERFADGRPRVPDSILERMKNVSTEEAWGVLRNHGYNNQFEAGWQMIHEDVPVVGRALTAAYFPLRPELRERMLEKGHDQGRIGAMNSWPIDELQPGDVYVADAFGKIQWGTLIGDNLGNAIFAKSGTGVVFDGSARDLEGLSKITGFNAFVRGFDPTFIQEMMLMGLNTPIRIGRTHVLPGDIVLAKREGVVFVPAHLAEKVVTTAEAIMLRDTFGHQRLKEGKYTPGQIDTKWTEEIEKDFYQWLEKNKNNLNVPPEAIEEMLKKRTW